MARTRELGEDDRRESDASQRVGPDDTTDAATGKAATRQEPAATVRELSTRARHRYADVLDRLGK